LRARCEYVDQALMHAERLGESQAQAVFCRRRAGQARDVALDVAAGAQEIGDHDHLASTSPGAGPDGLRDARARQRQVGDPDRGSAEAPPESPCHPRELLVCGGLAAAVIHEDQCAFRPGAAHQ
jgi:hypothetical protein